MSIGAVTTLQLLRDSFPVRPLLGTEHQRVADSICLELSEDPLSGELLRLCAENAIHDLRHSISLESLPEMATWLILVRLAAAPFPDHAPSSEVPGNAARPV